MKQKINWFLIFLFLILPLAFAFGQNSNDKICRVYGKFQGVAYDSVVKVCSTTSSDAACKDLLDELKNSFDIAVSSREEYIESNVLGCTIVLQKLEDGILFTIESAVFYKDKLQSLYEVLANADDIDVNSENL
jgi:hypothetical protein